MLAYLDLDYCTRILQSPEKVHPDTIHYLERLKNDVVDNLLTGQRQSCLQTMTPWAIRVKHEYDHSMQGRQLYVSQCNKNRCQPYTEDPLTYGSLIILDRWVWKLKFKSFRLAGNLQNVI